MGEKLRIKQTSSYTKLATSTLYKHVMERKIPHFKVGRTLLFDTDELDKYLEKCRRETKDELVSQALTQIKKGRSHEV
jgi:excisionase family DNA binding protein